MLLYVFRIFFSYFFNCGDLLRIKLSLSIGKTTDQISFKLFHAADPEKMGFRVLDNCAEENIK